MSTYIKILSVGSEPAPRISTQALANIQSYVDTLRIDTNSNELHKGYFCHIGNAKSGEEYYMSSGEAAPNVNLTEESYLSWSNCSSLLGGLIVAKALEENLLSVNDKLSTYLPCFNQYLKYIKFVDTKNTNDYSQWTFTTDTINGNSLTVYHALTMSLGIPNEIYSYGTYKDKWMAAPKDNPSRTVYLRQLLSAINGGYISTFSSAYFYNKTLPSGVKPSIDAYINAAGTSSSLNIPLQFKPGTQHSYGMDYAILGAVVAVAVKNAGYSSLAAYARTKIMSLMNMSGSWLLFAENPNIDVAAKRARSAFKRDATMAASSDADPAYVSSGNTGKLVWSSNFANDSFYRLNEQFWYGTKSTATNDTYEALLDVGLIGNSRDFAKILKLIVNGGNYNGIQILTSNSVKYFMMPQVDCMKNAFIVNPFANRDVTNQSWCMGFFKYNSDITYNNADKNTQTSALPFPLTGNTCTFAGHSGITYYFDTSTGYYMILGYQENDASIVVNNRGLSQFTSIMSLVLKHSSRPTTFADDDKLKTTSTSITSRVQRSSQEEVKSLLDSFVSSTVDGTTINGYKGAFANYGNAITGENLFVSSGAPNSMVNNWNEQSYIRFGDLAMIVGSILTMKAVEDGIIKLSDGISNYISELTTPYKVVNAVDQGNSTDASQWTYTTSNCNKEITILDLLNGQSGIYSDQWAMSRLKNLPYSTTTYIDENGVVKNNLTADPQRTIHLREMANLLSNGTVKTYAYGNYNGTPTTHHAGIMSLVSAITAGTLPLAYTPGTKSSYGMDYELLAAALNVAVARAGYKGVVDYARQRLFGKLNIVKLWWIWGETIPVALNSMLVDTVLRRTSDLNASDSAASSSYLNGASNGNAVFASSFGADGIYKLDTAPIVNQMSFDGKYEASFLHGLIGCSNEFVKVLSIIANAGEYQGKQVLSRESLDLILNPLDQFKSGLLYPMVRASDDGIFSCGLTKLNLTDKSARASLYPLSSDVYTAAGNYNIRYFINVKTGAYGLYGTQENILNDNPADLPSIGNRVRSTAGLVNIYKAMIKL